MSKELIRLVDCRMDFDGETVLDNINIHFNDSEFLTLLGPSGCGKTTTLRIIGGFLTPSSGDVLFQGVRINDVPPHKRRVNTVFQRYALFPHLDVYENIAFALRVIEAPTRVLKKKVPAALSLVGLAQKYKSYPKELSGGEQQRVAIARAIVNEPSILLADEPTGNLDPANSWEIMKLLEEANNRGTTVVVVTHNHEIVSAMKKRVVTMQKGNIVSDTKKVGV